MQSQGDSISNKPTVQASTNRAAHVQTGLTGPAHNRNIAAAAVTHPGDDTTNHAKWTVAENVKEVIFDAIPAVGATLQNNEKYIVVVNAPTGAIAKAWLEDAGGPEQDIIYNIGNLSEALVITRTTPITRVDVLPLNVVMRFVINATEDIAGDLLP